MRHVRDERLVPIPDAGPVDPPHVGDVEEVAVEAPRLSEDLRPLRRRVELHGEAREVELPLARLQAFLRLRDGPGLVGPVDEPAAVRRERIPLDVRQELRRLPFLQLEHLERPLHGAVPLREGRRRLGEPEDLPLRRREPRVVPGWNRKAGHAVDDPREVDPERRLRLVLRVVGLLVALLVGALLVGALLVGVLLARLLVLLFASSLFGANGEEPSARRISAYGRVALFTVNETSNEPSVGLMSRSERK